MIYQPIDVPAEVYDDEVVCFIANRYHTIPRQIIQHFLMQNSTVSEADAGTFRLEDNEMEILRGLIYNSHS